jgi:hypothetical protein
VTVLFICIHSINFHTSSERINPPLAEAFPHYKARANHNSDISAFADSMRKATEEIVEEGFECIDDFSLAPSRSASYSSSPSSPILPKSSSRIFVSYADGLDAFVDAEFARNALQASSHDTTDISKKLQLAVTTIQTELLTLEGDVNKLVADDKGLLAVAVFGLPPMYVQKNKKNKKKPIEVFIVLCRSHEDDPLRGVLAAIAIRDQLSTLNMECSIGVRYIFFF